MPYSKPIGHALELQPGVRHYAEQRVAIKKLAAPIGHRGEIGRYLRLAERGRLVPLPIPQRFKNVQP